jgi:mRNA interferase HigB
MLSSGTSTICANSSTRPTTCHVVFDVGGNSYRVVVIVRCRFKKVFVQRVMTHREYDEWNKLYRKGKV